MEAVFFCAMFGAFLGLILCALYWSFGALLTGHGWVLSPDRSTALITVCMIVVPIVIFALIAWGEFRDAQRRP